METLRPLLYTCITRSHNQGWRPQRGTLYYSARYPMGSTFQAIFSTNCAIVTEQKNVRYTQICVRIWTNSKTPLAPALSP